MTEVTMPIRVTGRSTLRGATEAAHVRMHANLSFAALLRGDMSTAAYRSLLFRLLGLHAPIEKRIVQHDANPLLAWRITGTSPSRAALLRQDLLALGLGASEIDHVPNAGALLPALDDPAAALGCAWVVEGSALGGRVMSSQVATILGARSQAGGGNFLASIPDQATRWRGCCAAIEICSDDLAGLAAMTGSAVATFAVFEKWLA